VVSEPLGKLEVVTFKPEGLMVNEKLPLAVAPSASVTVADTEYVPAVVGVPDIAPLEETLRPPPAEPENVYGGVPPLAESCPEYATPAVPVGRDAETVSGAGVTTSVNPLDEAVLTLSVTVTVKE
jgi:hypothetical protein